MRGSVRRIRRCGAGIASVLVWGLVGCTGEIGQRADGYPEGAGSAADGSAAETTSTGGPATGTGGAEGGTTTSSSTGAAGSDTEPGGEGNPTVAPTSFECDESLTPESPAWRRLTRAQYDNTLRDLLGYALGDANQALEVYGALGSLLDSLPNDERPKVEEDLHGTYRRLDQGVAQSHVDNWYAVAGRVAEELTDSSRLETVVGACASDSAQVQSCVDEFVRRFGARALRRPLTDEEVAFYAGFYGDTSSADPAGYADVVAGLLNAPQFLYMVEHGQDATGHAAEYRLSAFELASRLSYHFWNTMPDEELWRTAEDGSLLDEDAYAAQVERLFDDPRTERATQDFFREWLKLENLTRLDQANDVPVFKSFAGDQLPSNVLHESMTQEIVDLLGYLSWEQNASFDEVMTTPLIVPETAELAAIYGSDVSTTPIEAPAGERPGLLTRAAFLATGSANTRPIIKGVFIRENILCDHIPSPPGNAAATIPELSPELTTREVVEALTQQEGTVCASCHTTLINPLGFVTENYDALGRYRSEQRLFDEEGNEVGSRPVDTSVVPQVVDSDETSVDGVEGLMQLVLASGKAQACLARQYFRYSYGRWEHVVNDGCALEQLRSALVEGGSVRAMLREVALSPSFRQRTIE